MIPADDLKMEFKKYGELLWQTDLISYHAGNMSVRLDDGILITRTGAPLGFLKESDLIKAGFTGMTEGASSELHVHQMIYQMTDALAVIHSHPVHAVILSLLSKRIIPPDTEAHLFIGDSIPVVEGGAEDIARSLVDSRIVIVRGHGSFAKGKSLEEAFSITTTLERSCRIGYGLFVASLSQSR